LYIGPKIEIGCINTFCLLYGENLIAELKCTHIANNRWLRVETMAKLWKLIYMCNVVISDG